jgi:alpha-amylase/alpha-mannosidase (GH57 family)
LPDRKPPLELMLLWHMHQPEYRDYATGRFVQPWVYLHALKDYADMAAHLERHPRVRVVVNFVPVLLDQLEDYADQFASGALRDPLLELLARDPATPLTAAERRLALEQCFHANHEKMVQPYAPYHGLYELHRMLEHQGRGALDYLGDQYFYDLVTWYHLAWTGETVRRAAPLVARLVSGSMSYTYTDRRALFELVGEVVSGIVPRYRALAADGRVELSSTPHFHPLAPLVIDLASAREARADLPLPHAQGYPGGEERVRAQLDLANESHARRFGRAPAGIWPAEGAISTRVLDAFARAGVRWTASGEAVLKNSLAASAKGASPAGVDRRVYRPYRWDKSALTCFFRDDRLSDLIGFEYARWRSDEAAVAFVRELEAIAAAAPADDPPFVAVILDGENCWEYYPYNGFYFLDALYAALETHASIRTLTGAQACERTQALPGTLERVVAGSWVYGDLTTWIGSPEKNHAWDLLCAAKSSFDLVTASGRLDAGARAAATRQLAACEGSDSFWWMGDYNPAHAVARFDALFRANLERLYRLLGLPVPVTLAEPISRGGGRPEAGGAMRRAT